LDVKVEKIAAKFKSKTIPMNSLNDRSMNDRSVNEKEDSYVADSDGEQEDDDHLGGNKGPKKDHKYAMINEKRARFDLDISSQTSKMSYNTNPRVTQYFLEHRMPKKYLQFLCAVAI
jgi:hypothetical protein